MKPCCILDALSKAQELLFGFRMQMDRQDQDRGSRERIERYRRLISLNPKDVQLRFELGLLFRSLGRRQEALQEWRRIIQIDANNLLARQVIQDLLNDTDSNRDLSVRS